MYMMYLSVYNWKLRIFELSGDVYVLNFKSSIHNSLYSIKLTFLEKYLPLLALIVVMSYEFFWLLFLIT